MSSILDAVSKGSSASGSAPEPSPPPARRGRLTALLVIAGGLVVGAVAARWLAPTPADESLLTDKVVSATKSQPDQRTVAVAAAGGPARSKPENTKPAPPPRRKRDAGEPGVRHEGKKPAPGGAKSAAPDGVVVAGVPATDAAAPAQPAEPVRGATVARPLAPKGVGADIVVGAPSGPGAGRTAPLNPVLPNAPAGAAAPAVVTKAAGPQDKKSDTAAAPGQAAPAPAAAPPAAPSATAAAAAPSMGTGTDDDASAGPDIVVGTPSGPGATPPAREVLDARPDGAPEVTLMFIAWSRQPGQRMASVRSGGGAIAIVHEGEFVDGLLVSTIHPEAIDFTWTGRTFRVPVRPF